MSSARDAQAGQSARRCMAIVPAYLAAATLADTLNSLTRDNADSIDGVVVVVSPGDDSAKVAAAFDGVEVVVADRRLSAGAARNLGRLRCSAATWLLLVDADVTLASGAVAAMLEFAGDEGLDAVGPRILSHGAVVVSWLRHLLEFKDADRGRACAWLLPSAALLCTASAFDRVGGFPDMWPGEDLVFCHQLGAEGLVVGRAQSVMAWHRHPPGMAVMLVHQYRLGATAGAARLLTGMRGALFARRPVLLPLLALGRSARAVAWLLRYRPAEILIFALLWPFYLAGLCAWSFGFWAAVRPSAARP